MKRFIFLTILLLLLSSISLAQQSQDDWFITSSSLDISMQISTSAKIIPTGSSYTIQYLGMNLSFFPFQGNGQQVTYQSDPQPSSANDNILGFRWEAPKDEVSLDIGAKIKKSNIIEQVNKKIFFPLANIDKSLEVFTRPSPTIDSDNKEIIKLASELAAGEDDLYVVEHKLASWTKNNIKYDLSSLTADISQNASWVLKNREGVCDELTNLFIALNRALGIPARFVSGIAYTNSDLFPESWGPHGWAEVYFHGIGWIPFDVTYGQLGFVDPTHIKMKEAADATESSTSYIWYGRNIDVRAEKLDFDTKLLSKSGDIPDQIMLSFTFLEDEISPGSYNLIEAEVENIINAYQSAELYLAKSKEVTIIGDQTQSILLKPKEKKKAFWIIKVAENLDTAYIYTLPLKLYALKSNEAEDSFRVKSQATDVDLSTVESLVKSKTQEAEKFYSRNVALECTTEEKEVKQNSVIAATCSIKNTGNVFLNALKVCHGTGCQEVGLGISQQKGLLFSLDTKKPGSMIYTFTASNTKVSKSASLQMTVLDTPSVTIENINAPQIVWFDETYNVSFLLKRNSVAVPKNIKIRLNGNSWDLSSLEESQNFVIALRAVELDSIVSTVPVKVTYEDNEGNQYTEEKAFTITLNELTLLQKGRLYINKLASFVREAGAKTIAVMSLAVVVFIFIIFFVFGSSLRKRRL